MKSFDLKEFKARFGTMIASIRERLSELDVASDELHRAVTTFTGRTR
ncbi:MAG: hypothetical protein Q7R40_02460 [Phaeospirillum sp.]|nr:hypothetical protein [Phaeospirillum sp.]